MVLSFRGAQRPFHEPGSGHGASWKQRAGKDMVLGSEGSGLGSVFVMCYLCVSGATSCPVYGERDHSLPRQRVLREGRGREGARRPSLDYYFSRNFSNNHRHRKSNIMENK